MSPAQRSGRPERPASPAATGTLRAANGPATKSNGIRYLSAMGALVGDPFCCKLQQRPRTPKGVFRARPVVGIVSRMRRTRIPLSEQPVSNEGERSDPARARTAPSALTPRQRDVATLLVKTGLSCKQIAAQLHVREGTLRTHTEEVYRALGVHSRAELTVALRTWVDAPPSGT
jgi:DNA-binding CsgD family transcriptional regulator